MIVVCIMMRRGFLRVCLFLSLDLGIRESQTCRNREEQGPTYRPAETTLFDNNLLVVRPFQEHALSRDPDGLHGAGTWRQRARPLPPALSIHLLSTQEQPRPALPSQVPLSYHFYAGHSRTSWQYSPQLSLKAPYHERGRRASQLRTIEQVQRPWLWLKWRGGGGEETWLGKQSREKP